MRPNNNNNRNKNNNRRGGRRPSSNGGGQSIGKQKSHATNQKERYSNMARDAAANGERVDAEYYNQHVEHYSRILNDIAAKEAERNSQQEAKKPEQQQHDNNDNNSDDDDEQDTQDEPKQQAPEKPKRKPAPRKKHENKEQDIPLPNSALPESKND